MGGEQETGRPSLSFEVELNVEKIKQTSSILGEKGRFFLRSGWCWVKISMLEARLGSFEGREGKGKQRTSRGKRRRELECPPSSRFSRRQASTALRIRLRTSCHLENLSRNFLRKGRAKKKNKDGRTRRPPFSPLRSFPRSRLSRRRPQVKLPNKTFARTSPPPPFSPKGEFSIFPRRLSNDRHQALSSANETRSVRFPPLLKVGFPSFTWVTFRLLYVERRLILTVKRLFDKFN